MPGFTLCGDWARRPIKPTRALRVLFLTSVRDTGDCDRNGTTITTPSGERYMEGAIERVVRATFPGGPLYGIVEVAGVVTDDLPLDLHDYPLQPRVDMPWIMPFDLRTPRGQSLITLTQNIQSDFRALPRGDTKGRRDRKYAFERRIVRLMEFLGADVLISDHYMARLEFVINGEFGLFGRVLNIHPAVTVEGHPFCFRGKTPTADAIAQAKTQLKSQIMTGATLHVIDTVIDHGPPIAFTAPTPVYPTDEPQWLRYRNYQVAKLPLLVAGLEHYAKWIYPYLTDGLDLTALVARRAEAA